MFNRKTIVGVVLTLSSALPFAVHAASRVSCASLAALALPDAKIVTATEVAGGSFTPPGSTTPINNVMPFCRVVGIVSPAINFEVWLPLANWNGKYQGVGGGGFAGVISYSALAPAVNRGYAAASTDTGHAGPSTDWMFDRGLLIDYGYRAINEMTLKAKAIVRAFYGKRPNYSYFVGCSTGGRQGLMEAQRFPTDYDGVIAGAPVSYFTRMHANQLWASSASLKDPAVSNLPASKLAMITRAVLDACDALDGVQDRVLENPERCRFDPAQLACQGADAPNCLTPQQVRAVRDIYGGARNPRTAEQIYPGFERGSESMWGPIVGEPGPFINPIYVLGYMAFQNRNWDWRTFDFDQDMARADASLGPIMNAIDPDLRVFRRRGGKLILYHGWWDWGVAPRYTVDYLESVATFFGGRQPLNESLREVDDFVRLFMVPGMGHCSGGPGTDRFDMLTALEDWVERGTPPQRIRASHLTQGVVDKTRPLCPYPRVAVYQGSGDPNDEENFACERDGRAR